MTTSEATADRPPEWPLDANLQQLEAFDLDEVRGRDRLGALAFEKAPAQIRTITQVLRDLQVEDRRDFDDQFLATITDHVNQTVSFVQQMQALASNSPNAFEQKNQLEQQLDILHQWFLTNVRPRTVRAQVERAVGQAPVAATTAQARDAIEQLEGRIEELRADEQEIARELAERRALVDAQREAVGASGAAELSKDYTGQADAHKKQWKTWGIALIGTVVLTLVVATLLFLVNHPADDASNADVVSAVVLNVLVLGLLLYAVRVTSQQFRVHRHLEAVGRNKAAALSTFNRIVQVAAEPEVRTALATMLAQSVFSSEQTGFADGSTDQVTLIERLAAPVIQRSAPRADA